MTWMTLWNVSVINDHSYVHLVVSPSRSFSHSRLITGLVTRLTRQVLLVEQEHMGSPPVFSAVSVTRSLVSFFCVVDRCLSFCTFFLWALCCLFFDIRILIPIWYLQTLLIKSHHICPLINNACKLDLYIMGNYEDLMVLLTYSLDGEISKLHWSTLPSSPYNKLVLLQIIICPFVPVSLTMALYVLLRCTLTGASPNKSNYFFLTCIN